jgi:hypothetical protein
MLLLQFELSNKEKTTYKNKQGKHITREQVRENEKEKDKEKEKEKKDRKNNSSNR